eukprot:GEMP01034527.1.p1 GENE.GEMP01034527.1~~GEMP01034527.1.p1  ORF type:complete len:487 (+),score=108.71 GEMP01034527.1:51-1511(+)
MDTPKLRHLGEQTIDILCRYYERLAENDTSVNQKHARGEAASHFSEEPPEEPKMHEFEKVIADVEHKIIPYLCHWQNPRFMAYYPSATSLPAILGDALVAGLNPVGLQWAASPISTELEVVVMDWFASIIKLPKNSPYRHRSKIGGGITQGTASEAIFAAVAAAKYKKQKELYQMSKGGGEISAEEREELFYADSSKLVGYISDQSHFSCAKATRLNNIRTRMIPTEFYKGNYVLRAHAVEAAMKEDRAKGLVPCVVLLTYGSTNTCAFDDVEEYREISKEIWIHLDAAYAGSAWVLPDIPTPPLEICNSFNFNGSKWLLCAFDSAFFFVKDCNWLKDVFSASGDYLHQSETDQTIFDPEFKNWSLPLGRRFRALRLWLVVEYYGARGIREHVQKGVNQGHFLRAKIDEHNSLEQSVTTNLGLVVAHAKAGNEATRLLGEHLVAKGFLVYPSKIKDAVVLRFALGGLLTEMVHVETLWSEVERYFS